MTQNEYKTLRRMARIEMNRRAATRFSCYPDSLPKQMIIFARLLNIPTPRETIDRIIKSIAQR